MQEISPQDGPQTEFLQSSADIVFYGGAAGGGKTYALLLNPLYHINNPKFGAVTFRRTTKQIKSEGGLWDVAEDLYTKIGAKSNQQDLHYAWPNGAKHTFAHMEHEKNRLDWQGSQIALIQFDELTHFSWKQFAYMLSRNRSVSGVRPTIRATLNPSTNHWARRFIDWWIGGDGYAINNRSGVIRWFIALGEDIIWGTTKEELIKKYPESIPKSFTFIKSSLKDNQILMAADPGYLANLHALPRLERAQLLDGNWDVKPSAGMYFRRSSFEIVEVAPACIKWCRGWDQAATKKKSEGHDPDWTVGVKMGKLTDGRFVISHVERFQEDPSVVDRSIKNIAIADGKGVTVRLAQDPGQAGKSQAAAQTKMLAGYDVKAKPVSGDKATRAKPLSSQVEAGNVLLVAGPWNEAFLQETENFTGTDADGHDDQVDAAADAFDELVSGSQYNLERMING